MVAFEIECIREMSHGVRNEVLSTSKKKKDDRSSKRRFTVNESSSRGLKGVKVQAGIVSSLKERGGTSKGLYRVVSNLVVCGVLYGPKRSAKCVLQTRDKVPLASSQQMVDRIPILEAPSS